MIELNKEYTYKQICSELNWKESSGEAKQKQIKIIEKCYEFFHPESRKTHKPKKSYIFTKLIKQPELIDNRKSLFPEEEFDYLFNCIVHAGRERNTYFQRGNISDIYLSSSLIYREFGFDVYSVLNEIKYNPRDIEVQQLFKNICIDAVKANTTTRLCKKLGYKKNSLPKGILRQEGKTGKAAHRLIPDNVLLDRYNLYEQELLEEANCKSIPDAIQKGIYFDITKAVRARFEEEGIYGVERYNLISVQGELEFEYNHGKKISYQVHFQEVVLASIAKSLRNRINGTKKYKYELNDWQKRLMQNYLEQLLGNETETIEQDDDDEEPAWLNLI